MGKWQSFQYLWKYDFNKVVDGLKDKAPTHAKFEETLGNYARAAEAVESEAGDVDIDWIRIDNRQLAKSVHHEAVELSAAVAVAMRDLDMATLAGELRHVQQLGDTINREPDSLEALKEILGAINDVIHQGPHMQNLYTNLLDRFSTRLLSCKAAVRHKYTEDHLKCSQLQDHWAALEAHAVQVNASLVDVKQDFSAVTTQQVEQFLLKVTKFYEAFKNDGPGRGNIDLAIGLKLMRDTEAELLEIVERRDALVLAQKLFALDITAYPELSKMEAEMNKLQQLYSVYEAHARNVESFSMILWADLDVQSMIERTEEVNARLRKLKHLMDQPLYGAVSQSINGFLSSLPLMKELKSDALRKRHWKRLMEVTGKEFDMEPKTFTLGSMFTLQLDAFADEILKITTSAEKELTIESELKRLTDIWRDQKFVVAKAFKGTEDRGWVLRSVDEVLLLLEDMGLNLQSMMASPFVRPFIDEVQTWDQRLSLISECIEVWMQVQRKWMYLESIFVGSDDIRLQLPQEAKRFDKVDQTFMKMMVDTSKNNNILECCSVQGRLGTLQDLLESLEQCQNSLSEYLDVKRCAFPRFYFISDDELLSILGTSDPTSVQEHMLKLFDNCASLRFGRGNKSVLGMISSEGEKLEFRQAVAVEGAAETWMTHVEGEMKESLHQISKEGVFYYSKMPRDAWITESLGMVTLGGSQIWWTWETEDTFHQVQNGDKYAMKSFLAKQNFQLAQLTSMVRTDLSDEARKKVNQIIIVEVHAKDIIDTFVRDSIMDAREFAWESQLRFYWRRDLDDLSICQCTGSFRYGYEYMGINGRLVITGLTDRCYMTLTTALSYRLGGAPAGPAGTGKTETTKDLAKGLALLCVVFNCGEGLDYKAMGAIFSGLVQCGAWGCFDEFNRIEAEVLSVVSSQIKQIQEALKNDLTRFSFEGREIALDNRTGIFITMNPGYAGRTELPDNLKALFRPVTMIVPDLEQICEIMLLSEGFDTAKVLAKKMTVLYQLSREQLSKQHHYDFGLRALKSVLVMAGSLKRGSPDMPESLVLMRALRDMNLPKFVFDDVPLFLGLIGDLFPGMDCPRVRYPAFNDQVEAELAEAGYQVLTGPGGQVDKAIQLYETVMTRHTTMVVGQTGGGKSVIINTLAKAQSKLGTVTKLFTLNPKAIPISELYGVLDPETRDWTDGLLSNIFREINKPLPSGKYEARYLVFDGDVDAVWVENMNSVMDDNKLLTLPNGERIRLQNHCKLLFEVSDLQYASPATISRCGMVYVDSRNLGFEPYIRSWLSSWHSAEEREQFHCLYEKYVLPTIAWVLDGVEGGDLVKRPKQAIPMTNLNMMRQLTTLLDTLLIHQEADSQTLEAAFLFCVVWSCGAAIVQTSDLEDRERFDKFVKMISGMSTMDNDRILAGSLPSRSLFEYNFDCQERCWKSWRSYVSAYSHNPLVKFSKIVVPTVDLVRSTWLVRTIMQANKPCLFVGESGTAKTLTIQTYLGSLDPLTHVLLNMNFSSRTTSGDVQRGIEDVTEKRTKDTYGPPMGKKLVVFFDDLNMPKLDLYGTQQPIALLKLFIERDGVYDKGKDLTWKKMKDVLCLAAMGPPGGARNPVDPRFISLFNVFEIQFPSTDNLHTIFHSILMGHVAALSKDVREVGSFITEVTLGIYSNLIHKLPATPARFHYIFNLRDLSRVFEGLLRTTPDKFTTGATFVRVWRNEVMRVFHDRLIDGQDKAVVVDEIQAVVSSKFSPCSDQVLANPLLFGNFSKVPDVMEGDAVCSVNMYEDLGSYEDLKCIMDRVLEQYNATHNPVELVFFEDALEHVARVMRTLTLPRGNSLLVGVGGSGKQSITRLAAFAASCGIFEITLSRGYDENALRDDLKELYDQLGRENKSTVFLFTDSHVADEGFLELINNMLTSGMVPALYDDAEKDTCTNSVRDEVAELGLPETKDSCWAHFVNRCQDNLHVVLAMSPVGEALRKRCRSFPGMVNNTVIDWFDPWPQQALTAVATNFIASEELPGQVKTQIVQHMMLVHQSVRSFSTQFHEELRRYNYVTPKSYLDYISNYKTTLAANRTKVCHTAKRLNGGLQKLRQAAVEVDAMKQELSSAKVVVENATNECQELIEVITRSKAEVEAKSAAASEKEEQLKAESVTIAVEKEEAEAALEEAIPALEEAAAALQDLKKDDITEIRSFAKPNVYVQKVCECVVHLKGGKDVSWSGAKTMMADGGFLRSLVEFDKDALADKQV
eukprot:jgi/Ulvmu1/10601/UM065_0057.1